MVQLVNDCRPKKAEPFSIYNLEFTSLSLMGDDVPEWVSDLWPALPQIEPHGVETKYKGNLNTRNNYKPIYQNSKLTLTERRPGRHSAAADITFLKRPVP